MKRRTRLNVTIVGAGKVGSVLGRVLVENGCRVVCVVSRTRRSANRVGRFLRSKLAVTDLESIPPETDLIFIATPHSAVTEVAGALARRKGLNFRRIAVCHASGMLTAAALEPLRQAGATVFSFHPLQTFPRDFSTSAIMPTARGISYGVDGGPEGVRMARRLARILEGEVVEIPPDMRAFYHAACVVASNHLTTLMSVLESMHGKIAGRPSGFFRVYKPIIAATLRNIERTTPAKALSGPVARGGVETIRSHFDAILRFAPNLVPVFAAMSLETVSLALKKGSISGDQALKMNSLIHQFAAMTIPTETMP